MSYAKEAVLLFACLLIVVSFSACGVSHIGVHVGDEPTVGGGPPPHAPAHGYRAKYAYRYYPDACVYFDAHRGVYFYLAGDAWRMSVSLPQEIRVQLVDYVVVETDTDTPYAHFEEHRAKYPPGQLKKNKWAKKKYW
jgi:hypothetical protein